MSGEYHFPDKEKSKLPHEYDTFEEFREHYGDSKELKKKYMFSTVFTTRKPSLEETKLIRLTEEEMDKHGIQRQTRDACVHHYLPLQTCRRKTYYAPWKCSEERLRLERCYYKLTLANVQKSDELFKLEKKMRQIDEIIQEKKLKE